MSAAALPYDGADTAVMAAADLHRILRDHRRYVTMRKGARARLPSARLDGMMMAGWDLSEADLSGASLVGADLRGADLRRTSFYCANLTGCDLREARLDHADLRGASFKGANLSHASMDHADLRAATMLHLGDTPKFQGNAHPESLFGAVDFSNCSLRHASFRNAKLDNANFTDALLDGAVFYGARLRHACFRGATGVRLADPQAGSGCLADPSAAQRGRAKELLSLLTAHHEWFVSQGRKGRPAVVDGEDLRPLRSALKGMCLAGLSARHVIAVSVDFSGCELQAAKFEGADLRAANFTKADLSGTSLQGAKLAHARFRDACIQDLTLRSGNVLPFRAAAPDGGPFAETQIQSLA